MADLHPLRVGKVYLILEDYGASYVRVLQRGSTLLTWRDELDMGMRRDIVGVDNVQIERRRFSTDGTIVVFAPMVRATVDVHPAREASDLEIALLWPELDYREALHG